VILAIDQGTTGTTCLVFDAEAQLAGRAYREFAQHFPRPGWVEHDAAEIWEVTQAVALEALRDAGVASGELQAIGITNQRETVCVWDPQSGEPLHRALVWQDRRTASRCDALRDAGHEPLVRERSGLVLDPYFSATKIEWLLEHVDGLRERAEDGRAAFGTIDSWLVFKLTGEHLTDVTNASRTCLFDIVRGDWDDELLALFGDIPRAALPDEVPIGDAVHNIGHAALLILGLARGPDLSLIGRGLSDRVHQPRREPVYPRSMELLRQARDLGAIGASISGAGPTVLFWCHWEQTGTVFERVREAAPDCEVRRAQFVPGGADVKSL